MLERTDVIDNEYIEYFYKYLADYDVLNTTLEATSHGRLILCIDGEEIQDYRDMDLDDQFVSFIDQIQNEIKLFTDKYEILNSKEIKDLSIDVRHTNVMSYVIIKEPKTNVEVMFDIDGLAYIDDTEIDEKPYKEYPTLSQYLNDMIHFHYEDLISLSKTLERL